MAATIHTSLLVANFHCMLHCVRAATGTKSTPEPKRELDPPENGAEAWKSIQVCRRNQNLY